MASSPALARSGDWAGAYIRWHFPVACWLLLFLSVVAFFDNLVTDIGQPSNRDPKMVVHGLFLLGWMLLLAVQSVLPRAGRVRLHRRVGAWGFLVGAGVALSTIYLFVAVWKGWDAMAPQVKANRILLPSFALFMLCGWLARNRAQWHKRLVYAGTLFLMEPVLSRTFDPLVAPLLPPVTEAQDFAIFVAYVIASWSCLFLALLLYDWLRDRKLHPISLAAISWTYAVYAFVYLA